MEVEHLYCPECKDRVSIVWIDGELHAVCHCTHDGSDVRPVPLEVLANKNQRWIAMKNGADPAADSNS